MIFKKQKSKQRLTSDERRLAILEAAIPLLAEAGFHGATTKVLAKRVGVSEALLYQHFPSKEALYAEVQNHLCNQHPGFEKVISSRTASTESLVYFVFLVAQLVLDAPEGFDFNTVLPRVILQSVLDDGVFARTHLERNMMPLVKRISTCISAARKAGDTVADDGTPDDLRFIFGHHVIIMAHLGTLPKQQLFDYPGDKNKTIDHVVRFILRGIGLTEAAMARYYDPKQLKVALLRDLQAAAKLAKKG